MLDLSMVCESDVIFPKMKFGHCHRRECMATDRGDRPMPAPPDIKASRLAFSYGDSTYFLLVQLTLSNVLEACALVRSTVGHASVEEVCGTLRWCHLSSYIARRSFLYPVWTTCFRDCLSAFDCASSVCCSVKFTNHSCHLSSRASLSNQNQFSKRPYVPLKCIDSATEIQ